MVIAYVTVTVVNPAVLIVVVGVSVGSAYIIMLEEVVYVIVKNLYHDIR